MRVETITGTILQKMYDIGKCQMKFIIHLAGLYLSMRGRKNFLMMERYGKYGEQTYRQNFEKDFDFKRFNKLLIDSYCGKELLWVFDPSYIAKSGKHTPGVGYFWSGCAGQMKWGLELSALGVVDVEHQTALHYHVERTQVIKGEESLRAYYAKLIIDQAEDLQKTSKVIVFDAFFSKNGFVNSICKAGFTLVSRMQHNTYMRYKYLGESSGGKGRPKEFGGRVATKNLCPHHFKVIKSDEKEVAYEGVVHIRSLKRWCKVVVVHTLKDDGTVKGALIYFSTDINMSGLKVLEYYRLRYQIEFIFRDGKGHTGLENCQSRQEKALDFHFNFSLTILNLAKVTHWFSIPKDLRGPFSMADIKTQYMNEILLDRLISIYGKNPSVEKNNPEIKKLYQLGRIAA